MVLLTLVNIEVGLISGFLSGQFGSVAEIAETYTFLTIGDGLVFLVSIMLATVSARVALSKESKV
jgi:flagellar biosynthesis component FlhA